MLTPRQLELAILVAQGYTNHQIADTLTLANCTVANHVEHVVRRLGLSSRLQVAAWVTEKGVVGTCAPSADGPAH